jgi:uncharacterized protein YecE (DUF72 family)
MEAGAVGGFQMISIGLTSWGDHHSLYTNSTQKDKLKEYSSHFPIVEIDASFYAIQPEKNYRKWIEETPASFRFVVKAYQGMTGHSREAKPFSSKKEMFAAFVASVQPLVSAGKLKLILCQFPPWFDCKKEHVGALRYFKQQLGDLPVALEFRHQSWFYPKFRDKTLEFMKVEGWAHTVCDEPQAGEGSVPIVMPSINFDTLLVRLHGRNKAGWKDPGDGSWRDVRYLYRYSQAELQEWAARLKKLQQMSKEIVVLFNNNSGGDAADNAKQLIDILGIDYKGLAHRQLDLF